VRVWDLPLRLFHWSLLLLFVIAYATGNREQYYGVHKAAGFGLFGLLIFRLIWGFAGNRAARFSSFIRGPQAALAHVRELLRGRVHPVAGHNALGGWAVAVMLILLLTEVVSGLFSSTFDYEGPLAPLVSDAWADRMAAVHSINLDLLLAMIGLHLLAIAVPSILGRENLVASMIHGPSGRRSRRRRPEGLLEPCGAGGGRRGCGHRRADPPRTLPRLEPPPGGGLQANSGRLP
jgi:cytochrome b